MPAIAPLGLALFALQFAVGYGVYRYLAGVGRVSAAICGVVATTAGFAALFAYGVFVALAFDLVVLLAAAFVVARVDRPLVPG